MTLGPRQLRPEVCRRRIPSSCRSVKYFVLGTAAARCDDRAMAFWRRKHRIREIVESEAYGRSYGDRSGDVKVTKLPSLRPRNREVLASGEVLRRAFLERLEKRR
jgi:hypothetical protein